MKKILNVLGGTFLSVGTIIPVINYNFYINTKIEIVTKSYSYNFSSLDIKNIKFTNINGIEKAIINPPDLTNALKSCVTELFNSIDIEKSNKYSIGNISTNFVEAYSQNNDIKLFSKKFINAQKNIDNMNIQNHRLEIERYNDQNSGVSYFINALATIGNENVRLYGPSSYKPLKNLKDIQREFKNTFNLEITMEVWINGEDKENWGFELSQNMAFQNKEQIIDWLMINKDKIKEIVDHINKVKNTKITKMEKPKKLYKAESTDGKIFKLGDEYENNNDPIKDEYFYIDITSKSESQGEFKILVKNTQGLKIETI
ncbi:hypothetical protein [Spiroplasma endosymbiont of Atherix ibis]|uniref:hypothetical protein n=1 Tax=Spiroplasma endosymbiont of Atherix ibis TaxID=3066291 RepID=UPI0030CD9CF1